MIGRQWIILAFLLLGGGLLVSCGGGGGERTPQATGTPPAAGTPQAIGTSAAMGTPAGQQSVLPTAIPDGGEMAVDAVSGEAVDAARIVTGVSPFDVDIVVTKAVSGYQGYQYLFQWDPALLAYEGEKDLMPAGLDLCGAPTLLSDSTLYSGCAKLSEGATNYTGPVSTLTFHCLADGTSPLHLMTFAEDKDFGSTVLAYTGATIETTLTDASVTCQAVGQAPAAVPTTTP
jgi:hypothetical protein